MSSSIHRVVRSWSKEANWPYLSSIMVVNQDVPLFTDPQCDYPWILDATENRNCKEVDVCVIRYVDGHNLSLDEDYRRRDFEIIYNQLHRDGDKAGIRRLFASRAKYFYKMQDYRAARHYFYRSDRSLKNIMYIITSFCPALARWVVRKYTVFG